MNTPKNWLNCLLIALALIVATPARAVNLAPPTPGTEILDLAGTPIRRFVITDYSTSFVATSDVSTVTFEFRDDRGYFSFNVASVADTLAPGVNLLTNGTFLSGGPLPYGGGSPGWNYSIQPGVTYPGRQPGNSGGWYDGATGGYDAIDQSLSTVIGDTYVVSFILSQVDYNDVSVTDYQQVNTDCNTGVNGNGIDMLVFVSGADTPPTAARAFDLRNAARRHEPARLLALPHAPDAGLPGLKTSCRSHTRQPLSKRHGTERLIASPWK